MEDDKDKLLYSELTRISHKFSEKIAALSPDLHRQDSEAVLTQHCPRYPDDGSQVTERQFSPKICEKCGLTGVIAGSRGG